MDHKTGSTAAAWRPGRRDERARGETGRGETARGETVRAETFRAWGAPEGRQGSSW
jgi:hypothetical protein